MSIDSCARISKIFLIVTIYSGIALGHLVRPAKEVLLAERAPSISERHADPLESHITPAPYILDAGAKLELKRDSSVLCPGYSVVGNIDPYTNLWCDAGLTCLFDGYGGPTSYWVCGIPGRTYTYVTVCYDYPASCICGGGSRSACNCPHEAFCPSSAPYCIPWVVTDTKTYYQFQCTQTKGLEVNIVKATSTSTPPSTTPTFSSTISSGPATSSEHPTASSTSANTPPTSTTNASTSSKGSGLSRSDRIGLGTALGVGIPAVCIALLAWCFPRHRH